MKNRQLLAIGAILWIVGLGMTIAGLNIPGNAGKWTGVIGNILFLIGLMLEGVCWFRARRSAEDAAEEKRTGGRDDASSGAESKAETKAESGEASEPAEGPADQSGAASSAKAPGGSGKKTKRK